VLLCDTFAFFGVQRSFVREFESGKKQNRKGRKGIAKKRKVEEATHFS